MGHHHPTTNSSPLNDITNEKQVANHKSHRAIPKCKQAPDTTSPHLLPLRRQHHLHQADSGSDSDHSSDVSCSSLLEHSDDPDSSFSSFSSHPPFDRPTSPCGYHSEEDSDLQYQSDDDWDIDAIKYTGGVDLSPCFARDPNPTSSPEDSEAEDDLTAHTGRKSDRLSPFGPGHQFSITTRPASEDLLRTDPLATDNDDADVDDDSSDLGDIWPDEMDSDDFPFLHTWTHSWIWHPSLDASVRAELPTIHFHYIESAPPDQSAWTPLQDSLFGNLLTVPGHKAFNTAILPEPLEDLPRHIFGHTSAYIRPEPHPPTPSLPVCYSPALGRPVVQLPSLDEQEEQGLFSMVSSSYRPKRYSARCVEEPAETVPSLTMEDEDDEAYGGFVDAPGARRGRKLGRRPRAVTDEGVHKKRRQSDPLFLAAISEAEDGEEEEEC